MVCPVCKIEMTKRTATEWVCRNPRCVRCPKPKKEEKENG